MHIASNYTDQFSFSHIDYFLHATAPWTLNTERTHIVRFVSTPLYFWLLIFHQEQMECIVCLIFEIFWMQNDYILMKNVTHINLFSFVPFTWKFSAHLSFSNSPVNYCFQYNSVCIHTYMYTSTMLKLIKGTKYKDALHYHAYNVYCNVVIFFSFPTPLQIYRIQNGIQPAFD